jgi:hypothetical protein
MNPEKPVIESYTPTKNFVIPGFASGNNFLPFSRRTRPFGQFAAVALETAVKVPVFTYVVVFIATVYVKNAVSKEATDKYDRFERFRLPVSEPFPVKYDIST